MLDPESGFTFPTLWQPKENTLCERKISRISKRAVRAFAQSRIAKRLERVNWDGVLLFLVMLNCFVAGMLTVSYAQFAKVFLAVGGCR